MHMQVPPGNNLVAMSFSEELHEFIKNQNWIYAKTMPKWPHEYIVRNRVDENLFVRLVQQIRSAGYKLDFGHFYALAEG